jgi:hypothetical protein
MKNSQLIDSATKEKILAVTRCGTTVSEATGFFRVALGLHYLSGLMTKETLISRSWTRNTTASSTTPSARGTASPASCST